MSRDVANRQFVGALGDDIVVLHPRERMTKQEALVHAAWIVALADDADEFDDILEAVQNT